MLNRIFSINGHSLGLSYEFNCCLPIFLRSFISLICAVLFLSPVSTTFAQAQNAPEELSNTDQDLLENELEEFESSLLLLELIEDLPEEIAEKGINEGVAWLNQNKGEDLANITFINNNGYLDMEGNTNPLISTYSIGGCAWGIAKAIAMNALPWSKILKIKKAVKIMGGTKVVAKTVVNAYKHQRNLGYGKTKAIKFVLNFYKT
jgi:hypothetical protein